VEVAAIIITLINGLAAATVGILALFDNYRLTKSWEISWERRAPIYLGLSILLSHVVFAAREFLEYGSVNTSGTSDTSGCIAANESSWWGMIDSLHG
jgi:hypothetical protein